MRSKDVKDAIDFERPFDLFRHLNIYDCLAEPLLEMQRHLIMF